MEYTVKQIAEYLEVTKPTVQKIINDLEINPIRTDNRNCQYYNYQDAVRIIQNRKPEFDLSLLPEPQNETANPQKQTAKAESETAKPESQTEKSEKQIEKPQIPTEKLENQLESEAEHRRENQRELDLLQGELEFLKDLVKSIQKELEKKDNQLEIKDKQIQDLSDRLADAMQLTRGQQYIAAADKTKELVDKDTDTIDVNPAAVSHTVLDPKEEHPQKKKGFFARLLGL